MENERPIEILAPAGSRAQLEAAVLSGADAVYFGASDFNARRNAENFSDEDFLDAVRYCHVRGVKVAVTLNTLVRDAETERLLQTIRLIAKSGADAVIVQDLAVAALLKRHVPSLPLHASTQMAVHNVSGAKLLEEAGFARVVLARELSKKEIETIVSAVNCEIEVFVHGAHCMSASGLCYLSSVFGGRSGNRGLCAQPCRLAFKNDRRDFTLSLKDLSLLSHARELRDMGVRSLKIEGRMKRPEYVAAAVRAAKDALEGKAPDEKLLSGVFSRSGFTDGYYAGRVNGTMFGYRRKEDVLAAESVLPALRETYRAETPRVGLTMKLSAPENERTVLEISDGEHTVRAEGEVPEKALGTPTSPERAAAALTKLGGTPYFCASPEVRLGEGLLLPASALNALRREAVGRLSDLRAGKPHPFLEANAPGISPRRPADVPALRLRFENETQVFDLPEAEKLILDVRKLLQHTELLRPFLPKLVGELPVLLYPGDEARAAADLEKLRALGVREVLCENLGAIRLVREAGLTPLGGMHLNLLNSEAFEAAVRMGVTDLTASFEMNLGDFAALSTAAKRGFVAYGRLPLMRLRSCPNRDDGGCGSCDGRATVLDRRGEAFPLLCSARRFSTLYNPVPLSVAGLKLPRADFITLYFTDETPAEAKARAKELLRGEKPPFPVTAGLYNKKLL